MTKLLSILALAVALHAESATSLNQRVDETWNAKWQTEQRKLRKIIREWTEDCQQRIPNGAIAAAPNGLIQCAVKPAEQPAPRPQTQSQRRVDPANGPASAGKSPAQKTELPKP